MRSFAPLLIGVLLLSSCTQATTRVDPENALLHSAAAEVLTARMALRILEEQGDMRTVGIVVLNPAGTAIQSVRAWVRFDPEALLVQDLVVQENRFVLFAPGERTVDRQEGFVKFGGAVKNPLSDPELLLATFTVRLLAEDGGFDRPVLSFYDWRSEGDGHTAVLSLSENLGVLNIVQPPSGLSL